MNAFYEPFCACLKEAWGCTPPRLVECIAIVQPASFPIREIWRLGRDTIMYPPAQIIQRVVDRRLPRTRKASHWLWHNATFKQFATILQVCRHCLAGRENCFQQSDRLARHVGEGLHPHSVCPKVTHELLCRLNEPCRMHRVAFFFLAWIYVIQWKCSSEILYSTEKAVCSPVCEITR